MTHNIFIVDDTNEELEKRMCKLFLENKNKYVFTTVKEEGIYQITKKNIDFLLINEKNTNKNALELLKYIKEELRNNVLPIGILSNNPSKRYRNKTLDKGAMLFYRTPIDDECIKNSISNIVEIINANTNLNALTGLPSNIEIQNELKSRFEKEKTFAILYLDLDNFKAYNDVYGFAMGDELLKYTAESIKDIIFEKCLSNNPFVGNIGGDDFIAIIDKADYENICEEVIERYERDLEEFFVEEDFKKGYLEVANRRGIFEKFPLTSISIGLVEVTKNKFKNVLEIGEAGAQVKSKAKEIQGSSYVIDKRRTKEEKINKINDLSGLQKNILNELNRNII